MEHELAEERPPVAVHDVHHAHVRPLEPPLRVVLRRAVGGVGDQQRVEPVLVLRGEEHEVPRLVLGEALLEAELELGHSRRLEHAIEIGRHGVLEGRFGEAREDFVAERLEAELNF